MVAECTARFHLVDVDALVNGRARAAGLLSMRWQRRPCEVCVRKGSMRRRRAKRDGHENRAEVTDELEKPVSAD